MQYFLNTEYNYMDMKKYNVFETFSGIGAQNAALKNLEEKGIFKSKVIGTSDWDVFATQSYSAMHHGEEKVKEPSDEELYEFFDKLVLSADGKNPYFYFDTKYSKDRLINIYKAYKKSNNIGSIVESFERVRDQVIEVKGKIDLLTYSFPCQDLSSAGNFHGFNEGIKSHTRSGLLFEIEKLLFNLKNHKLVNGKVKELTASEVKTQEEWEREREARWNSARQSSP